MADNHDSVFEFRGVEDLFYARVTEDSEGNYTTETPKRLSYTATISKETESSSETHFYDNKGMIAITAKGAETFTLTVAPPPLAILADITGQAFDATKGMLIEGNITPRHEPPMNKVPGLYDAFYGRKPVAAIKVMQREDIDKWIERKL